MAKRDYYKGQVCVAFTPDDLAQIERVKEELKTENRSDAIRFIIRSYLEQIKDKKKKKKEEMLRDGAAQPISRVQHSPGKTDEKTE
jgi:Arc/MetJ-type ribon-helix-helix transcriptional regulator